MSSVASPERMGSPLFYTTPSPVSPSPVPLEPFALGGDPKPISGGAGAFAEREVHLITEDVLPETAKIVGKIIKSWKEYAHFRFGLARARFAETTELKDKEALKPLMEEDRKCLDEYLEVLNRIAVVVTNILNGKPLHVRILLKSDKAPLSIASYAVSESSLYIDLIATAPANLKMHIPNPDGFPAFKGAGTILIHSLYSTAQELGLRELHLKPLSGSASFYAHLGMVHKPATDELSFTVDAGMCPAKLLLVLESLSLLGERVPTAASALKN